jgi:hypothetical protein
MFVDANGKIFPVRGSTVLMPSRPSDATKKNAAVVDEGPRDAPRPGETDATPEPSADQPADPVPAEEK